MKCRDRLVNGPNKGSVSTLNIVVAIPVPRVSLDESYTLFNQSAGQEALAPKGIGPWGHRCRSPRSSLWLLRLNQVFLGLPFAFDRRARTIESALPTHFGLAAARDVPDSTFSGDRGSSVFSHVICLLVS